MKKLFSILLFALTLFSTGVSVFSEEAVDIIRRVDEKQATQSSKAKMSMIVYPNAGDKKDYRDFRILSYGKGDDESYMEFIYPKSIQGLRILSLGDDIWAYFSSTGRVRKIAGKSKSGSVGGVGGDFSYEDMGGGSFEESYSFSMLEEGRSEWIIRGVPKKDDISYSKILIYIDKDLYLPLKIEYFKDGDHTKTLSMEDIKRISGRETATRMEMVNHIENSMTMIIIHEAQYDVPIDSKYFTPSRFYK